MRFPHTAPLTQSHPRRHGRRDRDSPRLPEGGSRNGDASGRVVEGYLELVVRGGIELLGELVARGGSLQRVVE